MPTFTSQQAQPIGQWLRELAETITGLSYNFRNAVPLGSPPPQVKNLLDQCRELEALLTAGGAIDENRAVEENWNPLIKLALLSARRKLASRLPEIVVGSERYTDSDGVGTKIYCLRSWDFSFKHNWAIKLLQEKGHQVGNYHPADGLIYIDGEFIDFQRLYDLVNSRYPREWREYQQKYLQYLTNNQGARWEELRS